jgi:4-amino-4-deoxy-L-arabinose transferase-like glycosyltransferase
VADTLAPVPPFRLSSRAVFALWIVSLLILLAGLGRPVVSRTQEARVLETAREMLGGGFRAWMVPRLNDEVRLHKPPLAYWMAAASFKVFGVNEFAGRLPFALAGWLALGATYAAARRLVGTPGALFAAAALLSSLFFFKFSRLAETDVPATLFVTGAVYFFIRADQTPDLRRLLVQFHLAGACIGLAVLAKGPPAAFAVLFLLAWAIVERKWRLLGGFGLSGAWLTALVVAGWWFAYVRAAPEWGTLGEEFTAITRGRQHTSASYLYFPWMLTATAPWSALGVLGLAWVAMRMIDFPAMRALFIWGVVIFVPLCIAGQRQAHYLIPMMPVAVISIGVVIADATSGNAPFGMRRTFSVLFLLTAAVSCFGGVAMLAAARTERGFIQTSDLIIAAMVTAVAASVWVVWRKKGLAWAVLAYAGSVAAIFLIMFSWWLPSLHEDDHRSAAAAIRQRFGDGPYVLYGPDGSDPLLFNLRSVVPEIREQSQLAEVLRERPGTIVIAQAKNNREPPPVPAELEKRLELPVGDEGMVFRVYSRAKR